MKSYGHKEESEDQMKVVITDPPDGTEPIDIGIGKVSKDLYWVDLNHTSRSDKYGVIA